MPIEQAQQLFERLTEAVAYIHERGIQHRDIKPQNILLTDETVPVLVDFGLVLEAGATRLTADGLRMGTVSYVPPEWAQPTQIDPLKWDVYSLGTVFWEVLVGRRAFPLPDDMDPTTGAVQVMAEKRQHPPLDPGPDMPFYLRLLIRDMTHPDPRERPADAGEVLARLRAKGEGEDVDPVELFRTPMPSWYQEEPTAGPTLDGLASSGVPLAPSSMSGAEAPAWWRSFVSGAIVGGVVVALLFAAVVGWMIGMRRAQRAVTIEPNPVPVAPPPEAPAPTPPEPVRPEPAPEPAPADEGTAAPAPVPLPIPSSAPAGPVLGSDFAAWIAKNPDWSRDAAQASGMADAGYLKGWDATGPAGPATRVSWYAAAAYCETRGGMADLAAEPLRWEGKPYMELRHQDGKPAWRGSDGRESVAVDPVQALVTHGFRCASR